MLNSPHCSSRWVTSSIALFLFVIAFLVFSPTLEFGFVNYDDPPMVCDNPFFRGFGWRNLKWMWTTLHTGPYQPLSWMSLALDYVLWGENDVGELVPFGYHLTNVLLHATNTVLVFFLALRLLTSKASDARGAGCDRGNSSREQGNTVEATPSIVGTECRIADLLGATTAALFFRAGPFSL